MPTASHSYTTAGSYIVSVQAQVRGVWHDNYQRLVTVTVSSTFSSSLSGNQPGVAGTIVTNSSPIQNVPPTSVIQTGGSVTFMGSYTTAPTNPLFSFASPTIVAPGGTLQGSLQLGAGNTSATAAYSYSSQGTFPVTFVGKATSGSAVAYQNYTWTVFVAPTGLHAGLTAGGTPSSPHKGSLNVYELAPGGANSEDPAIDYETVGYEVIINVYQTLIAYNGSQTGPTYTSYVPEIAACVPGSPACSNLFGSTLITTYPGGNNYTFVLDSGATYYDPANPTAKWGVYPTDVLFSVARTMGFATQPCFGCNNGWILTQSLLPTGNSKWDGGIHGARNNTPSNVYQHVLINNTNTGNCPTSVLTDPKYHGCVTFVVNGAGQPWPYFLELIADPLGGAIVPCGWFSAAPQSAGIPTWTYGNVSGAGDHPCGAPGSTGYGVANPSSTAWDAWETKGAGPPFWGNVQYAMAGSGPYYLASYQPGLSYTVKANPNWVPSAFCGGSGCQPAAGKYVSTVSVSWETTQTPGEQAYASGVADFASIPSTDTALLLSLIQQGKVQALSFPSISIFFFPYNFLFNAPAAAKYTSNPITAPQDFFSHIAAREFVNRAYPYSTIETTINTKDGIQYGFNYGGAIPQFMANYYPANVSWPTSDPCSTATDPTCPTYWWAQGTNPSSPYYDSELAACHASNPCELPLFGQTGAPDLDERMALWAASVSTLSGGAVKIDVLDINFVDLVINSLFTGPTQNPMPFFTLGWAPDYPDPTDYVIPLYYPDSTYTAADTVNEQLTTSQFNASSCHLWSDYTYWAQQARTFGISDNCQGAAYAAMTLLESIAAVQAPGPLRVWQYNQISAIANDLALYTYQFQEAAVLSYASWITGTSYNENVTIGGGSDSTWFTITGNGVF